MKDPMKMLRQVQQMQDRMAKAQKELEEETVEATSGGGAVRALALAGIFWLLPENAANTPDSVPIPATINFTLSMSVRDG